MSPFRPEPCGRCGHDVNQHVLDAENELANECDLSGCDCDGFITATAKTAVGPDGEDQR